MKYAAISCDEATMIDNQSQVNIHAYLLEGFKKLPIFFNQKMLVGGGIINNLNNVILNCLPVYGDLTMQKVYNEFNFFGSNDVAMFIGVCSGVTTQIFKTLLPFMLAIHCVMHWTNLVMQPLSNPQCKTQGSFANHIYIFFLFTKKTP